MFHPPDSAFNQAKVIHVRSVAPSKPGYGETCNGCGVCCLAAPCPLGILLSRRTQGACAALAWDEAPGIYRCGALSQPLRELQRALPRGLGVLARPLSLVLAPLARRWIAAGQGCDSQLHVQVAPHIADNAPTSTRDGHDR